MKRFIQNLGLTIFVLCLWHGEASFAAESRIALVIGNSGYTIAPPLANPANDARLMAETLRGLGFDVIERIDADRETIQTAAFELQDRLIAAGKDAVGLFYYAGHGVQVGGENYLVPLGADIKQEREVAIKAVSASFVLQQMEFAENRMNFVILDACRNNPLTRGFRSATRGLARMDAPRGSLVAYSTGPGSVAADGTGINSPYTLALAEAMRVPGLAAEQMFKRVRNSVMAETNGNQTPWEESSLTGANFYFNADVPMQAPETTTLTPTPTPSPMPSDIAATKQQETQFWKSIEDSDSPAMFEAYLDQYPKGTFALLAKLKRDALEASSEDELQVAAVNPQQQTERAVSSQRIINIQPIRDMGGYEQPILVDILRNMFQVMPNSLVISDRPSNMDDVVISGSILKHTRDIEVNPEYQSAQIASQLFGSFIQGLTQKVPPSFTIVEVEVLIAAQDNATGRIFSESGHARLKIDSTQVNPNQAGINALKTAVTMAAKRIIIRMTGGTVSRQISIEEIRNDPSLRNDIIRFYNEQKFWRTHGRTKATEMVKIHDISLASVSDDIIKLNVKYRWEYRNSTRNGRNDFGVVTVQRTGLSYRMISLE